MIATAPPVARSQVVIGPAMGYGFPYSPWGGYAVAAPGGWGGYGYGYFGYGFPGYGFGYGNAFYGPFGGMGMSLYDQQAIKDMVVAQAASRINLNNARASEALETANLLRQQVLQAGQLSEAEAASRLQQQKSRDAEWRANALAGLDQRLDETGRVRWPESAPVGLLENRRNAVDAATQVVYRELQQNGRASIRTVVDAKRRLHAYGQPALDLLAGKPERPKLVETLNAVEVLLEAMGNPPPRAN
jgi:uncharacterized membrane protein